MNKMLLMICMLFSSIFMTAQGNVMEEYMYSSGKIWVAIGVLFLILILIFTYLRKMDKKLDRMEDEFKS
jgi:H+/gluconate symporter-like permease